MLKALKLAAPLLSLLGLMTTSCGAEDDLDTQGAPYDIRDTPALSITRPGVYKTSVEIVEDNCSPSLKQLLDSREDFPPSSYLWHTYFPINIGGNKAGWSVRLRQFHMRPGKHHHIVMSMSDLTCDEDTCTGEFNWTDKGFPNRCVKLENWTAQVSIDQVSTSILHDIQWTPLPCEIDSDSTGFNHTPKRGCREKYWIHTDYEKPIECEYIGFSSSGELNEYGRYEASNSLSCN